MTATASLQKFLNIGITSPYETVGYLQFGVASPSEILEQSACEVNNTGLKNDTQERKDQRDLRLNTVYDPRMGVLSHYEKCQTCGNGTNTCPGHFGHIMLEEPVVHPKFFKVIISILKCVCGSCSSSLVSEEHMKLLGISKYKTSDRLKHMTEHSLKLDQCPKCNDPSSKYVIKDGKLKMYYKDKKKMTDMTTKDIYNILVKISNEDYRLLGFNQNLNESKPGTASAVGTVSQSPFKNEKFMLEEQMEHRHQSRPEWMIFTVLPVLPICDRPYSFRDREQHDDDLTDKYISIVKVNQKLRDDRLKKYENAVPEGEMRKRKMEKLTEKGKAKLISELEEHIRTLFDNSDEKSKISGGRPHKGIKERISQKEGQVRQNIMGKRCDFTARTVAGGDPTLEIDQIGMPRQIAKILTKPEFVNARNIEEMQAIVNQRKANFVFRKGQQIMLEKATHGWTKEFPLQVQDVVERQLRDGDWVLVNRQPTLRLESMMGVRVRLMDAKTFRTNLSITTALNLDFDGDID